MKTREQIDKENIITPILCKRRHAHRESNGDCDGVRTICGVCGITAQLIAENLIKQKD